MEGGDLHEGENSQEDPQGESQQGQSRQRVHVRLKKLLFPRPDHA
jgi:hypothetical protein